MKNIKYLILLTMLIGGFTSCEKESSGGDMKFKRANIVGAKYLTLASGGATGATKANVETSRVYKIDEKGNMTAVVFYVDDNNGGVTTSEKTVVPNAIYDYGEQYVLFYSCSLISKDGFIDDTKNLLIRKSDGAIFDINFDDISYFPDMDKENNVLQHNAKGEMYMLNSQGTVVSKATSIGERFIIKNLTSKIAHDAEPIRGIRLDKNDNFYVTSLDWSCDWGTLPKGGLLYLANGGVIGIKLGDYPDQVILIDNELHVLDYKSFDNERWLSLHKMQINTNSLAVSYDLLATIQIEPYESWPFPSAFDTPTRTIFTGRNSVLYYDKTTRLLSKKEYPYGFEDKYPNKNGMIYVLNEDKTQITEYNFLDITINTVNCDRSTVPPYITINTYTTLTEIVETGVKSSDGSPMRVITDCKTGRVSFFIDADDRKITELIKVN